MEGGEPSGHVRRARTKGSRRKGNIVDDEPFVLKPFRARVVSVDFPLVDLCFAAVVGVTHPQGAEEVLLDKSFVGWSR